MKKIIAVILFILAILPLAYGMQVFTGAHFTEADPGNDVTVETYKVSWSSLETRNSETWVYRQVPSQIKGNFEFRFSTECNSTENSTGGLCIWGVSDTAAAHWLDWNAGNLVDTYHNTSSDVIIFLHNESEGEQDDYTGASEGTQYWLTVTRIGTEGTAYIYDDGEARTHLVDTLTITMYDTAWDYLYALSTPFTGSSGRQQTGFVEYMTSDYRVISP